MKNFNYLILICCFNFSLYAKKNVTLTVKAGTYNFHVAQKINVEDLYFKLKCRIDSKKRFMGFPSYSKYFSSKKEFKLDITSIESDIIQEKIKTIKYTAILKKDAVFSLSFKNKREIFYCYADWSIFAHNIQTEEILDKNNYDGGIFNTWLRPSNDSTIFSKNFKESLESSLFYQNRYTEEIEIDKITDKSIKEKIKN